MPTLPDFSHHGYQAIERLNHNLQGGRMTYLAIETATQKRVVVKQFRFANGSNWDSYKEIEREIDVLKSLEHPGIPRYLAQFSSNDGLCLVQEHKDARALSQPRSFKTEEIKDIALQLLEILVYLQDRIPPIIHRDIKPENVLIDNDLHVYLVDFGLARIGDNTLAFSSMMGGTLGFMPPEQIHNQKLTKASDLYGVGATLICLITQTKSVDIGYLVDFENNRINYKNKIDQVSLRFTQWLDKMVEPNPNNRYQNAKLALKAIIPIELIDTPEVILSKSVLEFTATSINEKLSQILKITNRSSNTLLCWELSIVPHPNDPPCPQNRHTWIHFSPPKGQNNRTNCLIQVDTSKLKASSRYEREIILNSNARQEKLYLLIRVKTASIQPNINFPPYSFLFFTCLFIAIFAGLSLYSLLWVLKWGIIGKIIILMPSISAGVKALFVAVAQIGGAIGGAIGGLIGIVVGVGVGGIIGLFIGSLVGGALAVLTLGFAILMAFLHIIAKVIEIVNINTQKILEKNFYRRGFNQKETFFYLFPTVITGILCGVTIVIYTNSFLYFCLIISTLYLISVLITPLIKWRELKAQYYRQESKYLIEP